MAEKNKLLFCETSAKDKININKAFEHIVDAIYTNFESDNKI